MPFSSTKVPLARTFVLFLATTCDVGVTKLAAAVVVVETAVVATVVAAVVGMALMFWMVFLSVFLSDLTVASPLILRFSSRFFSRD
jgi:hypothetical protein